MHIVLFGGSFNPPHLGHVIVISQAFELIRPLPDELWLLPDYQHSFAKNADLAPAKHRVTMTQLLHNSLPKTLAHRIRLCRINIDFKLSGNTWDHLQKLQSEEKYLKEKMSLHTKYKILNTKYSFLMGSDNLSSFTKWPHWQELLKAMPFYIYPRAGVPMQPLYTNMIPLKSPLQAITNISSTMARQRLVQNLPISHLVPTPIETYIHTHQLYTQLNSV